MSAAASSIPNVHVIGLSPEEHEWVRLLIRLLRDPDPVRRELARQALVYMESTPARPGSA